MENNLLGYAPAIIALCLIALELGKGCYGLRKMPANDRAINLISLAQDSMLIRPALAYFCAWVFAVTLPAYEGSLKDVSFWPAFILFLFGQDFLHYWVHRWAHHNPVLWKLHRTHHSAQAMSVLMTARLNMLWQVVIPANYIAGLAIYLGMSEVFWWWFLLRAVINFMSHSDIRWDLPLYNIPWLKPLIWPLEHIFTSPDAHHAHHGYGASGQPMGNFAPVIIFWDFVFGTARLPHSRQEKIGIEGDPILPWYQQLWWPLFGAPPQVEANSDSV